MIAERGLSAVRADLLVREIVAAALDVQVRVPPDVWAETHLRVPSKGRARPGPVRLDLTPYLRRPLRCLGSERVRQVTLMCGTQLGKTMLLDAWKCWTVDQDPGTMIVYYPDDEAAQRHNTKVFFPMVQDTPVMRPYLLDLKPRDAKLASIDFATMTMYFFGIQSRSKQRSLAAGKLCYDELSAYVGEEWTNSLDRTKSFERSTVAMASSPTDEGVNIDAQYKLGTMERWWVPCPHCDAYQQLRLGRRGTKGSLTWDVGGLTQQEQIDHARSTARYICGHCGQDIYEHHKPEMERRGVWVPESMNVDEVRDEYARAADRAGVQEHDYRRYPSLAPEWLERGHHSHQLSSLHSQLGGASFGDFAKAVVESGGITRRIVNGWMGEPWVQMGDRLEVEELRRLCVPAAKGGYRLATLAGMRIPAGVLGITAGADVQKDRIYVDVYGWGTAGVDCWLIDRAVIPRTMGRNLIELDAWLGLGLGAGVGGRIYTTETGQRLTIFALAIDSGHFTSEVYECVRRLRAGALESAAAGGVAWGAWGGNVYSAKGTGERSGSWGRFPVQHLTIDKWPDGTPMPGGCEHLTVNIDYFKTDWFGRIRGLSETEDELKHAADEARERGITDPLFAAALEERKLRPAGLTRALYLPDNEGGHLDEYLAGITAEHRAEDRGTAARPRALTYRWQPRPGAADQNHDLDCTVYAAAVAMATGVRTLGVEAAETKTERGGYNAGSVPV